MEAVTAQGPDGVEVALAYAQQPDRGVENVGSANALAHNHPGIVDQVDLHGLAARVDERHPSAGGELCLDRLAQFELDLKCDPVAYEVGD